MEKQYIVSNNEVVLFDSESNKTTTLKEALGLMAFEIYLVSCEYSNATTLEEKQKLSEKLLVLNSSIEQVVNAYNALSAKLGLEYGEN